MIATLVSIAITGLLALSPASSSVEHSGPIVIDGDPVTRIVKSHPGAETVEVAGESGLYRFDGGAWVRAAPPPPPPEGEIVSDGSGVGLMLAGDHAPCMRGGPGTPLQRSDDGGATWDPVAGAPDLRPLAIWAGTGLALAASCPGPQLSSDGGQSWAPLDGIEPGWELTSLAEIPQSDDRGPVVLVGLTGEGGTSYLRSIDLTDPAAPVVSEDLRMYYAIGGLAGFDDTFVLAAIDGVWLSDDAGMSWERSAEGLEDVVLERDPAEFGFPADIDPSAYGLFSATILPGERTGIAVGSVDGLFIRFDGRDTWSKIEGSTGRVEQVGTSADGSLVVYATDQGVFQVDIPVKP